VVNVVVCKGLATLDVSELPDRLLEMSSNPVLHSYKFLNPSYSLSLNVKKHADVSVLIAVIDSAHYTVTYTEEGTILYKVLLKVRNNQRQFIRISASSSPNIEIWSTVVANNAVKPAKDSSGMLMIPLQKTSKIDKSNADPSFPVELVFILKTNKVIKDRGELSIELPYCDIPINQLFVSIFLPMEFIYGEFTGMREIISFSGNVPYQYESYVQVQSAKKSIQPQSNPIYKDRADSVSSFDDDEDESIKETMISKSVLRGVVPVKVDMPTNGREFKFEQLFVSEKYIILKAAYKKKSEGFFNKKRSTSSFCC